MSQRETTVALSEPNERRVGCVVVRIGGVLLASIGKSRITVGRLHKKVPPHKDLNHLMEKTEMTRAIELVKWI